MKAVIWITAVIAVVAAATIATPALAERQFNRCPDDPSVNLPGPEICSFSFPVHVDSPAGTRCSFDVTIDYVLSGTIMFFENPASRRRPYGARRNCDRKRSHLERPLAFHRDGESRDRLHRPRPVCSLQAARREDDACRRGRM
jgi:hypothetical protein